MFETNINIILFCQDVRLESLLQAVPDTFLYRPSPSAGIEGPQADLALVPPERLNALLELRAHHSTAQFLLWAAHDVLCRMEEDALRLVDGVLDRDLPDRVLALQIEGLCRHAALAQIKRNTSICLDTLINSIPDMVWFKDIDGIHVKVNDAFCHTVGKPKQEVQGQDHCTIWDVSREEFQSGKFACQETDALVITQRRKCFSTEKVKSPHGMRQFNTYKAPLINGSGAVFGTVGVGHDVTDLENMGAELEIILRSMPFAILVRNDQDVIINANERFEAYFGVTRQSVIGQPFSDWARQAIRYGAVQDRDGYIEATVRGQALTVEIHEEPIYDVFHNEVGRLGIYRDVTKERELEAKILRSSDTDFLTGLDNRRSLYRYLRENCSVGQISLMYVDLDHFKQINDTYGHQVGDMVLVETAHLLQECFPNDFIARIGGDEFLIVLRKTYSQKQLMAKTDQLLDKLGQIQVAREGCGHLTASIGIAQSDRPSLKIDELIRRSDAALYQAKLEGRARSCFYRL